MRMAKSIPPYPPSVLVVLLRIEHSVNGDRPSFRRHLGIYLKTISNKPKVI